MRDAKTTGQSRHLREILKSAREKQGRSAQDVADGIASALGRSGLSGQSVRYYEAFERHPPIDVFAAWARTLGYRLIVDLDRASNERIAVLVRHPEVAEIARLLDDNDKLRSAVMALLGL